MEPFAKHKMYLTVVAFFSLFVLTFFVQFHGTAQVQRLAWLPQKISKRLFPHSIHKWIFPLDLYELVKAGNTKALQKSLEKGVNPNQIHHLPPSVETRTRYDCCGIDIREAEVIHPSCDALHLAVIEGRLGMVVLLVKFGANPHIRHFCEGRPHYMYLFFSPNTLRGYTAIDEALNKKQTAIIEWFKKHGFE
ncbi:MAG: ankyrin repeat domain-containing protein [Spirochaetota bacterium]